MNNNIIYKRVEDSKTETAHLIRPTHLNGADRLFGGTLIQWIDEVAAVVAKRHAGANVTTASIDNLMFLKGAYKNDLVIIRGKMTWVGKTSMEVCVDTFVESLDGKRTQINNAHFIMVALDKNGNPLEVPRLLLETEAEKLAWDHGEERRRIRMRRKEEHLDGI